MVSVELYDMTGHLLVSANVSNNTYDLNLEQFPSGVYILKAVMYGRTLTKRVIRY
jgi:hypothetical protein